MATVKLNIGCGRDHKPGWVNIDAVAACKPDVVHDLRNPMPWADESVSAVLAQDIIEHFTKEETVPILAEIWRVLIPGGTVEIRVPNPDAIIKQFAAYPETRNEFLYGTTTETGVFGAHKQGFTAKSLATLLIAQGFAIESFAQETTNFLVTARKSNAPVLKRLTVLVYTRSWGGAEVFLADLLAQMQKQGVQVNVYSTGQAFRTLLKKNQVNSKLLRFHLDVIGNWRGLLKSLVLLPFAVVETVRLLRQSPKTEVLLLSGFTEKLVVTPIALWWGIPVVWIEFGPLESVFRKFYRLPKFLYRLVAKLPQMVIVPSRHTLRHVIPVTRIPLDRFTVIPCGRTVPAATQRKRVLGKIVCVSRLEQGKGQDILLKTFPLLRKHIPHATLHIIGVGAFEPELRALAAKLNLSKSVQFRGTVPDALAEMATAELCVFPSVWELEGFGLTVIEAMSVGTPVVAFENGPAAELILDTETGMLVSGTVPQALAESCIKLLSNRARAKKMATAAQQRFSEHYTIQKVAKTYLQQLQHVLAGQEASRRLVQLGWFEEDL